MLTDALVKELKSDDRLTLVCRAYIELLAATYPRFILDREKLISYCGASGITATEQDINATLFVLTKVRGIVSRVETSEGKTVFRRTTTNHKGPVIPQEEFAAKLGVCLIDRYFDEELHEQFWPSTKVKETYDHYPCAEERRPELEALDNLLAGKKKNQDYKRVILNGQGGPFKQ